MRRLALPLLSVLAFACGRAGANQGDDAGGPRDANANGDANGGHLDANGEHLDASGAHLDAGAHLDGGGGGHDAAVQLDAGGSGVIGGGPCLSGAPGATAYRVRWADGGGTAYTVYEVNGLPQNTADHAAAYGYTIGFEAPYEDIFLAQGGVVLDDSDFIDLELSTAGVSSIATATLAVYGRSYNTTASGSFNWQTFDGTGEAPTNLVANSAPYQWYGADMTTEISPGDTGVLIRVKAGPSSDALVVNRIELCMVAN